MKVIVVKQDHSRTRSFRVSGQRLAVAAALVVTLSVSLGGGLMYGFLKYDSDMILTEEGLENWKQTLLGQKQDLASVREDAGRQLDALTLRLAELQGRITRLDALGERLTLLSNLDDGEFDFSQVPALGGPEQQPDSFQVYAKPSLTDALDKLAEQIDNREQQLQLLDNLLINKALDDEAFLSGLPAAKGWLSSRFGARTDPFTGKDGWHNGIDYAAPRGTDILSLGAGVVVWSGDRWGFGTMVEINHGNGYVTRYAHNDSNVVKVGDIVTRGQVIAKMGSSGRSTGSHVHLEVLENGKAVDPQRYMYRAAK
ncbi:M23 family metallopeptidase [Endozoicomonas gorgoniicola]|uniref:M23 family metallopeptidase n=1 Tax=Endozoicomonas gorgoniicola TaxID=1234144 RepID=A0ABT3MW01_9GAMM|nr:M23 family metallopeptidase [Endozoicomonas gorgoniicola]MCW7553566.1 M23 family metallopeptidase [Endozoicomonas gorgoniicola]